MSQGFGSDDGGDHLPRRLRRRAGRLGRQLEAKPVRCGQTPLVVEPDGTVRLLRLDELPHGGLTPEAQELQRWTEAGRRYQPFQSLVVRAMEIEVLVLEVLERTAAVGEGHKGAIRLSALTLSQGLLPLEIQRRCYEVLPCPYLHPEVQRLAIPLAVGQGKTLLAAATAKVITDLLRDDPECECYQARGLLYSASSLALLENMLQALDLMGVPREAVGVYHRSPGAELPSIEDNQLGDYPVLLVTQQMLQAASGRERNGSGGVTIEDLLAFCGKDRLTIWDESFRSSLADSAQDHKLAAARATLADWNARGMVVPPEAPPWERAPHEREFPLVLNLLEEVLRGTEAAADQVQQQRGEAQPVVLPPVNESTVDYMRSLVGLLHRSEQSGPAEALDGIASMAAAGGLDVHLLWAGGRRHVLVRPRVVISDRLERLVVLDAGYMTDLISRMDPTVRPARFVDMLGEAIQPKQFSRVVVHCYRGPSGRGYEARGRGTGYGLADTSARRRLIREQVDRVARLPLTERALIVTYRTRDGGPKFKAEIEAELNRKVSGWRDTLHGRQRVEVICWGEHVGRNDWRQVRHLFFIGVLRRSWASDLQPAAFAAARGSAEVLQSANPLLVEANQAANEIMQAIGRGHARVTEDDEAGEMHIHLPFKETLPPFAGMAPCPGSPLYEELKGMMPGCQIVSESLPPKSGKADVVANAVEQALAGLDPEVSKVSTRALRPLVVEALPTGFNLTVDAFRDGVKLLAERNAALAAEGKSVWVKPTPTSQSWVRFDPADAAAAAA